MKLKDMNDRQLADVIETKERELAEFRNAHRWTADDAQDAAEDWILKAKAQLPLRPEVGFPSGSRSALPDSILEIVASHIVSSRAFHDWLLARCAECGGRAAGVSSLSRVERDKAFAEIERAIADAQTELARRDISRRRVQLETELAALSGDAA